MENKLAIKRLFWVGCFPSKIHSIGDHAQTYAIQKMLESKFGDYRIYRFSRTETDKFFKCRININDLIFIHSSGDFGDLYNNFHKIRKQIIEKYPNNFIVQLPVSVHYESATNFESDKIFFSNRKNILILTRTVEDYKILKANFDCKVQHFPDFVYSIRPKETEIENNKTRRKGILFAFRNDYESIVDWPLSKELKKLHKPLKILNRITGKEVYKFLLRICQNIDYKNMTNWLKKRGYSVKDAQIFDKDITDENRENTIYSTLDYYKKYKLVITDRFHAGVFCKLTNTPYIMVDSKIKGKKVIEAQDTKKYFDTFRELVEENKKFNYDTIDNHETDTKDIMGIIKNRRSIRKWTTKKVPNEIIKKIVTAGVYAPSACSSQAVSFKVLTNKNDLEFICNNTSLWFRNNLPNAAICVFYNNQKAINCGLKQKWHKRFIWQDTACAMMNMMLMAESLNVKSCWASVNPKQQKDICKYLGIKKDETVCSILLLGYSNQKVDINKAVHQRNPIKRKEIVNYLK